MTDLVPRSVHVEQLLRADYLQQELSRVNEQLAKLRRDLAEALEGQRLAEARLVRRAIDAECPRCFVAAMARAS